MSAYALFYRATALVREHRPPRTQAPTTDACAVCSRAFPDTEAPDRVYPYRYGSAMATEYLCLACATPRIASPEVLGIERYAAGNPDAPVGAKLGMLPGSGGLVTAGGELHLALPPGFMRKFEGGVLGTRGQLHECTPLELLLAFESSGRLGPAEEGFIYISQFGRKSDRLMSDLRLSHGLREVWFNSDEGARPVDLAALLESARWLCERGLAEKARRASFWAPVARSSRGHRDERALEGFAQQLGGVSPAQELIDRLPVDPHDRVDIARYMRTLIPALEQGNEP